MINGITIIVCTFNGISRLGETIKHLAAQAVPDHITWEIILADNASTDGSASFFRTEWASYKIDSVPLTILTESKPGKLYALQRAISAATHEYFIICDDDNWLADDYVAKAHQLMLSNPGIGALGGFGIPITDGAELPDWFQDYQFAYAVGPQAKSDGLMPVRSILWGAGLVSRKSVYTEMYGNFPSFLEGQSVEMILAEDTEYCLRLTLKNYRLYYSSELKYQHYIQQTKLTPEYRDRQLKRFHDSGVILRKYYAAIRAVVKTKGRPDFWTFLLMITPLNYLFSFNKRRAEKARDTLFHLLPFKIFKTDVLSERLRDFIRK